MNVEMHVTKRNGKKENMLFDKILNRLKNLGKPSNLNVNYTNLVVKIIDRLYDNIKTTKIDELTAEQCASLTTTHYDYNILASRIIISNHQKNTEENYLKIINDLYNNFNLHKEHTPLISENIYNIVQKNPEKIQNMFDYNRDFNIDFFGFKTLERAYLIKKNNTIIERPQHMWMRVALGIHGNNLDKVKKTYDLMSQKYFTHATPTLFNAGTKRPQCSSCYLLAMEDDSIKGIYNTLADCAAISKWAGGIGLWIHNIRGSKSHISGTNGKSNGIVPMLRVYNSTARYVDQGGGRRNGSFAIYLEPWHLDIIDFLELKKNHGDEEMRARDLFYALWIPDLFMERVEKNEKWTLLCPNKCRDLYNTYGEDFKKLYEKYEAENNEGKIINARDLWFKILDSQIETGTPYMLYKDSCNKKSNQKNLGVIKSSNLCTEIVEYSDENETAVCNLASIGLSNFIKEKTVPFNNVTIYTKENCKWCILLKLLLKKKHISYKEIILTNETFTQLKKQDERITTVPQLFDNDTLIGGYNKCFSLLKPSFDYEKLHDTTKIITENLNKIIDINFYPTEKTKISNFLHRPIGIGVQGLADTFAKMDIPFYSEEAKEININIFETIYHAALEKSYELALERKNGLLELLNTYKIMWNFENDNSHCRSYTFDKQKYSHLSREIISKNIKKFKPIKAEMDNLTKDTIGSYSSFIGSPASKGLLQFDLWNEQPKTNRYNWENLKNKIIKDGLRNSLLVAPMPTASTSQILGNNECFEPFTSNIYVRRTLAGEFIKINKYLMNDLLLIDMWNEDIKNSIIANNGSIQQLTQIPKEIRDKFLTVWEIPMKHLIDMSKDRGIYICQSQSLNLWMESPTYKSLTSMHFYSWKSGLKTGLYYLRTKAKAAPQQFTIEPQIMNEDQSCEMCSG